MTDRTLPVEEQDTTPVTMADAEDLYATLQEDCVMIQAQLSNKDHRHEDGERLTDQEYHQWRAKATWALSKKRVQMGRVKRWITDRKQEAYRIESGVENPSNAVELFGALLGIINANGWEDLSPREQAIVKLSERWIRNHGAPAVVTAREKTAQAVAS